MTSKQRKLLKSKAHHLRPVIMIGKSEINYSIYKTVDECLSKHELIKIKFNNYKDTKAAVLKKINTAINFETIGIIGNTAIIFRQNKNADDQIYKIN